MRRYNMFAIFALLFFVVPVVKAGNVMPAYVCDAVLDTVVASVKVEVSEVSDSLKEAMKPKKRTLVDGKKYGTVKGIVTYEKGDALENAKLEFVSEDDIIITTSSADGTFSVELIAGEYVLNVSYQEQKIKPVNVKVKAGKTVEISKDKLEFDAKLLSQLDVTAKQGKRLMGVTICDLAKSPLINAELHIYALPDMRKAAKVLYSDFNGRVETELLVGDYLLRPYYLGREYDDIRLTIADADAYLDDIVINTVKHLNPIERMTTKSRDALISLYKKEIGTDKSRENYRRVYEHWKKAFCARPDRHLVQYLDGIAILNASISADTVQKRYDRLKMYNEVLMDIFELAIVNIDTLNSQISGTDTLTVAKLRAQQLEYLRANWQLDTIMNSPIVTKDNTVYKKNESSWYSNIVKDGKNEEINWDNVLFANDIMNTKIYNMTRSIVESEDLQLEMKDIDAFAKTMFYKFRKDTMRVGLPKARQIYSSDTTLAFKKARSILAAVKPDEMLGTGVNAVSKLDYFTSVYQRGINRRFSEMASWVVDSKDIVRLVEVLERRWNTEGDTVVDQILANKVIATNKDYLPAMNLYYKALRNKNEKEHTYDRTLNIINRAAALKLYNDVVSYAEELVLTPEFQEESGYKQAVMYLRIVDAYTGINGSMRQKYPLIMKAIKACPEYSDPYYYRANLVYSSSRKAGISFCVAYDLYAEAKQKRTLIPEDSDIKPIYSVERIQEQMNKCIQYFPEYSDEYQKGSFYEIHERTTIGGYKVHVGPGRKLTIPGVGEFKTTLRAIERESKE